MMWVATWAAVRLLVSPGCIFIIIIMRVCSAQRTFAEQLETMELSPEQKAKVPPRPLPSLIWIIPSHNRV